MGSRIYEEGRTQIPLSSPTTIDPLAQDPGSCRVIRNKKKSGGNTPILVLKRMLRHFLKIPPLTKILNFKSTKLLQKRKFQTRN